MHNLIIKWNSPGFKKKSGNRLASEKYEQSELNLPMKKIAGKVREKDRAVKKVFREVAKRPIINRRILGHSVLSTEKEEKHGHDTNRYFDTHPRRRTAHLAL